MSARDLADDADAYVLGLLDPSETEAMDRRIETDPACRAAVAASRDRFVELDMTAHPASLPAELWNRIEGGIATTLQDTTPASSGHAIPANDNPQRGWRQAAMASMAATVLLAAGLGWSLMSRPDPQVVAILLDNSGAPLVLVEDYGDASARITPLSDFDVPAGRALQVWTLPNQQLGPVSLGLLDGGRTATLDGPDLPQPQDGQLYEITLEQAGGSPTGRPTGPILVKGFAKLPR